MREARRPASGRLLCGESGCRRRGVGVAAGLGTDTPSGPGAEEMKGLRPFTKLPIRPMRPFMLKTDPADAARAMKCLTQAVYYEAAKEPQAGQEAVGQVVLNRVR